MPRDLAPAAPRFGAENEGRQRYSETCARRRRRSAWRCRRRDRDRCESRDPTRAQRPATIRGVSSGCSATSRPRHSAHRRRFSPTIPTTHIASPRSSITSRRSLGHSVAITTTDQSYGAPRTRTRTRTLLEVKWRSSTIRCGEAHAEFVHLRGRGARRDAVAASTNVLKFARLAPPSRARVDSGCHCTASQNGEAKRASAASMIPSLVRPTTRRSAAHRATAW